MRIPKKEYWKERGFETREEWLKWRMNKYREKTSKKCIYCSSNCWGNRVYCSNKCTVLDSFEKKENGCWEWIKGKNPAGYGVFKNLDDRTQNRGNKMRNILAHRSSYNIFKGEIPEGKFVCHTCDNRSCCNPDHLWIGDAKQNARDALRKNRLHVKNLTYRSKKGCPSINAKLTEDDVKQIKKRINNNDRIIEISEDYNVGFACIYNIKNGKTWSNI